VGDDDERRLTIRDAHATEEFLNVRSGAVAATPSALQGAGRALPGFAPCHLLISLTPGFRRSVRGGGKQGAIAAWLRRGEVEALGLDCAPFDRQRFRAVLDMARPLTRDEPSVFQPRLTELFASAGVALVWVPELTGAPISGATRWLSDQKALVQLSLRYKSDDQPSFSLFHEAAHVPRHLQARQVPGHHSSAHRPAPPRLRSGWHQGEGAREAGRGEGAVRGPRRAGGDPQARPLAAGHALQGPGRVRARAGRRREENRPQAAGPRQVGLVGYEINFNRYFYHYTPPRPLEEIEADIRDSSSAHAPSTQRLPSARPRPGRSLQVREAIERLRELRTALISAAATGRIDVREVAAGGAGVAERLERNALPPSARLFRLDHGSLNSRVRYSALLSPEAHPA